MRRSQEKIKAEKPEAYDSEGSRPLTRTLKKPETYDSEGSRPLTRTLSPQARRPKRKERQ